LGEDIDMKRLAIVAALAGAVLGSSVAANAAEKAAAAKPMPRGEYLAKIMGCGDCHTPGILMGKPDFARFLGGSEVGFEIPGLGIFYPPNLTSDPETGLGKWTEAQIVTAVRTGVRPDGRQLAPIMPSVWYKNLTDSDARALARYIKSLPPVRNKVAGPVGPGQAAPGPYMTVKMP
jgi:mono/diheme cytochrome c family protein